LIFFKIQEKEGSIFSPESGDKSKNSPQNDKIKFGNTFSEK
jgi:hypothetical protein